MGLLKAYFHKFTADDNVELVLVSSNPIAMQDLNLFILSCGLENPPKVTLVQDRLTDEELRSLYHNVQCYVSAHHAEGFGLGIFEATLSGLPVIATKYSGNLDFSPSSKISYQLTPAVTDPNISGKRSGIAGVTAITKIDPTGIAVDQLWASPNLRDFAEEMLAKSQGCLKRLNPDTDKVRRDYSYKKIGKAILARLSKINARRG